MNQRIDDFLTEYIPDDCRDEARRDLQKLMRQEEEERMELQHEADASVMLDEDMEE